MFPHVVPVQQWDHHIKDSHKKRDKEGGDDETVGKSSKTHTSWDGTYSSSSVAEELNKSSLKAFGPSGKIPFLESRWFFLNLFLCCFSAFWQHHSRQFSLILQKVPDFVHIMTNKFENLPDDWNFLFLLMLNLILNIFLIVRQNLPDCRMQMLAALHFLIHPN